MKAAVLYKNNDIRCVEIDEPRLRPHTVKIRVHATGICGSDVPRVLNHGAHFYPIVLGHEFSGEVVACGEGVTRLKIGDTVSGAPLLPCMDCADCQKGNYSLCKNYSFIGSREQGSFAEYVVIPEANAVRYDSSVPYEQAAMFEPSTVALHGVLCNDFRGGETVAVLGCGTIGIFTIQWAKILGARKVIGFDLDNSRLELAKKMGADEVVNTKNADFLEQARDFAGKEGYSFVFEAAGNPVTMRLALELAGNKAHVCFIGTPHMQLEFTPTQWENLNRKEMKLTGSWMSYSAPFPGKEWEMTAHYFSTGELKFDPSFIFKKYPLSEVDKAFALYLDPSQVKGKIMLML